MGIRTIDKGSVLGKRRLEAATAEEARIPDAKHLVHVQFRRFAGCPFCGAHLQSFMRRHYESNAADMREAVVFQSTAAKQHHQGNFPFPAIADPEDEFYAEFTVARGYSTLLHPGALLVTLPNIIRMLRKLPGIPTQGQGVLGVPADFLPASDERVRCHGFVSDRKVLQATVSDGH